MLQGLHKGWSKAGLQEGARVDCGCEWFSPAAFAVVSLSMRVERSCPRRSIESGTRTPVHTPLRVNFAHDDTGAHTHKHRYDTHINRYIYIHVYMHAQYMYRLSHHDKRKHTRAQTHTHTHTRINVLSQGPCTQHTPAMVNAVSSQSTELTTEWSTTCAIVENKTKTNVRSWSELRV